MKETKQNACIESLVGIQELKLFVTCRIFLNVMHPFLLRTHTLVQMLRFLSFPQLQHLSAGVQSIDSGGFTAFDDAVTIMMIVMHGDMHACYIYSNSQVSNQM